MPIPFVRRDIPVGGIIWWFGNLESKPSIYHVCDGTNGTPDLRNRFVLGAPVTGAIGITGGATAHDHVITTDDHLHNLIPVGTASDLGGVEDEPVSLEEVTGSALLAESRPPFKNLHYIMRIK